MDRRDFVAGAGAAAAVAAAGASASASGREEIIPARTIWRGDANYEATRQALVWNGYKPERFPAVIVQPRDAAEVAHAVRFAAARGMKVKARSGGHNWTASFLRDNAMVIDLGALNDLFIDQEARTASLGPAVHGNDSQKALTPVELFFPTGHCPDVAVGGYMLQGGWGWNSPKLGLANALLESAEVVTADGRIITASPYENPDFFWAVRGSGAGFFGIVTRYHVRLTPRPKLRVGQSLYRREDLPQVLAWAAALGPDLPDEIEMNVFMMPDLDKMAPGGFVLVNSACFATTDAQAAAILESVDTCPIKDRALVHRVAAPSTVADMYALLGSVYRKGLRFGADNMLSNAPPDRIIPAILAMVDDLPTPISHVLWYPFPIDRVLTDTSMAIMGTNYLVGYGACETPADDAKVQSWATRHMKAFEPLAVGMQLGDENLASRPDATILKPGAAARLEALRAVHDPSGVFHSYYRGEGRA